MPLPKDTIPLILNLTHNPIYLIMKDFKLYMKANSLYEPLNFSYNTTDSVEGIFGQVHHVHNNTVLYIRNILYQLKATFLIL